MALACPAVWRNLAGDPGPDDPPAPRAKSQARPTPPPTETGAGGADGGTPRSGTSPPGHPAQPGQGPSGLVPDKIVGLSTKNKNGFLFGQVYFVRGSN